jgi:hypothetical protein
MTGFAFATTRFMASYGCRLEEELLFLLGCPLFLSARWAGTTGPRFETENPCRFEYLASAFGSPYQLRTIDGLGSLAWVAQRIERREPLLLDLPEAVLLGGVDADSGRRVCAFVSSEGDEVELSCGPSRRWTLTLSTLAAALLRSGDTRAVMFYAPLQPLPEAYLREVVRQSLVKQHALLRACPHGEGEVGIATLRASLREGTRDRAAIERHRRLLASLRPGPLGAASPAAGRQYYAQALRAAAPRCGTVLRDAADAFGENASAWSSIAARAEVDGLSAEAIGDLYEAMWKAESTLVQATSPVVAEVCA